MKRTGLCFRALPVVTTINVNMIIFIVSPSLPRPGFWEVADDCLLGLSPSACWWPGSSGGCWSEVGVLATIELF